MYSPSKKLIAQLLLCSLLLESCYNPNLGTGKKTLPAPAAPAYQQELHDKPPGLSLTPPGDHPIPFPEYPHQPQAVARGQGQPRATSQPLPSPSREAPSTRPASLRKQNALLRSQSDAQAERKERIARAKPANELAQITQPRQAAPATPVQSSSPADQVALDIADQAFPAQGGEQVRFRHQAGQWQASVTERISVFSRIAVLPVVCERHRDIAAALRALQGKPTQYVQRRLHVITPRQVPYVSQLVYLGELGLQGGMDGAGGPSGSGEPQEELPTPLIRSTSEQPIPAGKEPWQPRTTQAVQHFIGADQAGIDLRKYDTWYDNVTLEYLASTLSVQPSPLLKVVFHDQAPNAPKTSFASQLAQLQLLKHKLGQKGALFISKEPGAGVNHYLLGMLYGNQFILLNPVGASKHQDLYEALAEVREQGLVEELYLSKTRIQQEEQLVSCGPISAELLLHYGALEEEALEEVLSKICSVGEVCEQQLGQGPAAKQVSYQEVEVSQWLPASLRGLLQEASGSEAYQEQVVKLRQSQLARLAQMPQGLTEELPEQVCFNKLVIEDQDILSLADSEPYQQLAQRVYAKLPQANKPSGSGKPQGGLPPRRHTSALGGALRPAVPSALELTKSQGPTQFEQDQQEAAKLQEEIPQLYAKLPQATEEADAQVVEELSARLARLLELEDLCAPAPGSDGAREHIARLRQDHHTHWGSTAYGAKARQQLTALLDRAYGQALKREALEIRVKKTSDGVARLVQVLEQLAVLHQEQGEATGDLAYYTDAAILYQNMLSVCERELQALEPQGEEAPGYQSQIEAAYSGLAQLRQALLAKAGAAAPGGMSAAQLQVEITNDQQALQALRDDAKERVDQLEALLNKPGSAEEEIAAEKAYIEGSRALFEEIAQGVKAFLARLYQESENELGPAPCKYTVMGLGSMALAQMTPYSDLEFAILMEDAPDAATAATNRAYLRQLTHLVHLRVINLGETVIPKSKYDISLDHLGKRGLNFDLGGKTPLGRKDKLLGGKQEPYDLIQPVAGMMHYLKNEGDKIAHIDKLLPFILENTCYVHGDEELHAAYVAAKSKFLTQGQTAPGLPVYQARALKKLVEGVVEMDYSEPGKAKSGRQQKGNLAEFEPQFGLDDAGRLYDVKQEIYRLPDRLLYGLAMYYGILPESGWNAVAQLAKKGIIGQGASAQDAAHHLQYIVSFATMLRLSTYLHHGKQEEGVTMLRGASQEEVSEFFTLPPAALQAGGSLFKYYYTALPLHSQMEKFFKMLAARPQVLARLQSTPAQDPALAHQLETLFGSEGKFSPSKEADFFQAAAFYDDSDQTRGDIHLRLLQHAAAKTCYERALKMSQALYSENHPAIADALNNVGIAYDRLGQVEEGLKYFEPALKMRKAFYEGNHPEVAQSLNNVGVAYNKLGQAQKGLKYKKEALAMFRALYEGNHPEVAGSLSNVGSAYEALGQAQKALEYKKQALEMRKALYKGNHPAIADALNNVSSTYQKLGQVEEELKCQEEALEMRKALYKGNHPAIADALNNVGTAYHELGQAQKALEYYKPALEMFWALYEGNHPAVAGSLNNMGIAYEALGQAQKALEYYKPALEMHRTLYKGNHPLVAFSLNSVGAAYGALGQAQKALEYKKQALEMRKALYPENHPDVAESLNNVGLAYEKLGQAQKALEYKKQALKMYQNLYKGNHPEVAASLNNVGLAYQKLDQVQEALEYFKQALEMRKDLYKGNHPDIAQALNNVGLAYGDLGQTQKALEYQKPALEMYQALYAGDHPEVAKSLNNVGVAYERLKKVKEALKYYKSALKMYQALYKGSHPEVAQLLHNVGQAYQKLEEYQQAKKYLEQALAISKNSYGIEHRITQTIVNNLVTTTAPAAYKQHDVAGAISQYKAALLALPAEQKETKSSIGHNLGCMYHVAAIAARQEGKEELAQSYLAQATATFEEAVAASEKVKADLYAEYANFLIAIEQFKQAYPYLLQAIASGDGESELGYGLIEQAKVSPILHERIARDQEIELRGIDYAYYLLIHHYEAFKQAGIELDATQAAYLTAYQQAIDQRTDKGQQDELAYYLLGSLYQELGNEPAAAQAFALAQEVLKQENKPQ